MPAYQVPEKLAAENVQAELQRAVRHGMTGLGFGAGITAVSAFGRAARDRTDTRQALVDAAKATLNSKATNFDEQKILFCGLAQVMQMTDVIPAENAHKFTQHGVQLFAQAFSSSSRHLAQLSSDDVRNVAAHSTQNSLQDVHQHLSRTQGANQEGYPVFEQVSELKRNLALVPALQRVVVDGATTGTESFLQQYGETGRPAVQHAIKEAMNPQGKSFALEVGGAVKGVDEWFFGQNGPRAAQLAAWQANNKAPTAQANSGGHNNKPAVQRTRSPFSP